MKETAIIAVGSALLTGVAIATQSTLNANLGRMIGPLNSGLVINLFGGACAAAIIFGGMAFRVVPAGDLFSVNTIKVAVLAGFLGIMIMGGAAFALQRVGIAVGTATIFMGQMLVGVLVDALGWGGLAPVAVDLRRIVGLVVLALAVYLIIPRG